MYRLQGGGGPERETTALDGHNPVIIDLTVVFLVIKSELCGWVNGSEPPLLSTSNWSIALLEAACPPSFVPLLAAGLAELVTPLAEYRVLQPEEVAVLFVVRVCKAPREASAENLGLVYVGADD